MKLRVACLLLILVVVTSVASASHEATKPTPAQMRAKIKRQAATITRLRGTLADTRAELADARDAQAAAEALVADQKSTIADRNANLADRKDQIAAQDAVIADQNATITRLRARDPLDAVLARDADGQWAAMLALWRGFPVLPSGVFCGYDKRTAQLGVIGLTATTYTFYLWSGC